MSSQGEFPDRIALCGFAASGKSTIAPMLAKSLGYTFVDTDAEIVKSTGLTVADYFSSHGERAFRKQEQEIIRKSLLMRNVVIALGGGALIHAPTRRLVARATTLIYLSCSIEILSRRLITQADRPLLVDVQHSLTSLRERVRELRNARLEGYSIAELKISTTTRTPRETVQLIRKRLQVKKEK